MAGDAPVFVPTRLWIVMIVWVAPAVAALGLGSWSACPSRARTSQEANQLGGAVILPLIFLVVGQATGLLLVALPVAIAIGAVIWVDRLCAVRTRREALHPRPARREDVNRPRSAGEEHELQDRGAEDQDQQHRERDRRALPHESGSASLTTRSGNTGPSNDSSVTGSPACSPSCSAAEPRSTAIESSP